MESLLTEAQKAKIKRAVRAGDFKEIIYILEKVKTAHAGTAKTKDKRFVIRELVSFIKQNSEPGPKLCKAYFKAGNKFCKIKQDVAIQIGLSLLWRGYSHDKQKARALLLKAADHKNWEVRETAGGAFANILFWHKDFYKVLMKWTAHESHNVRRAVVIGSLGLRNTNDTGDVLKAFRLLEPLMYDASPYVKKNLGPFVLGSYFGNAFPIETFKQLDKWVKIRDGNVRWNVTMAFNNSFGNKYPEEALRYLKILNPDPNPVVQRAVKSTLNHLKKRYQKLKI